MRIHINWQSPYCGNKRKICSQIYAVILYGRLLGGKHLLNTHLRRQLPQHIR